MKGKKFLAVLLVALLVLAALPTMALAATFSVTDVEVVDGTDGYTPVTAPKTGQKLTANIQTDNPDQAVIGSYPVNSDAKYKWYYEGSDNVLGTEATYTVTSDNVGKTLCVEVSVDGYDGTATWKAAEAASDYKVTGVEVVDGTDGYTPVEIPEAGQKLTANIQTDNPDQAVIGSYPVNSDAKYKWHYAGSDNVLGTEATYTVTSDNIGKTLCVEVSVDGYDGTATWEAAGAACYYKVTGVEVVDGTDGYTPVTAPKTGQKLTANILTSDPDQAVIGSYPVNSDAKYKWYYEGSDNVLGTEATYTVTSDNVGKTLCVEVSVKGYGGSAVWTAEMATDERMPGDVNGDGVIDLLDMVQINNVKNGTTEFDDEAFQAADLNGDGIIDLLDLVLANNIRLNK